jgi:tetratricopeptide (TPR) repeat protein
MKDLFAAREAFEAGKKQKARKHLQAVEPEVEKMLEAAGGELRGETLNYLGMFLHTLGSLGEHKQVLEACRRWQKLNDDWELRYQAGVASFNLGRFMQAAAYWSGIHHVPHVANMQFVAQLVQQGTIPPLQLEYDLPDPDVVQVKLNRETADMTKKGLRSGLVIMVLLEMIFDEIEVKGVAELSWPLLSFTGSWGAELGFGLMKCGAVSQAVRIGMGLAMMKAGHFEPEDVFTEEELQSIRPDDENRRNETAVDERQRFSYNAAINGALRMLKKQYEENGIEIDTRYMDYFGDVCPRCGGRIRANRGVIDEAASVSSYLLLEQNKAVVYCICKKCARQISRSLGPVDDTEVTEARISARLPDLARSKPNGRAEKEKEWEILRRIHNIKD